MKNKVLLFGILGMTMICCSTLLLAGAMYLLAYSLKPSVDGKNRETVAWLKETYPGTIEWMDSMMNVGALRDTFIVNDKGVKLHAYLASCESAQGTVVLAHGYTDEARRMMMLGKLYHDSLQFNALIPDHEFHGESEGKAVQMGWLDRLNLELWIGVADSIWQEKPTYLHGISMGGATVMMCSGDELSHSVKGIIDDCGYTSVWDEFSGEIRNQFGLPAHPLLDIASCLCKLCYGWDFKEASALEQVRKSTLPILFIHGDEDTFVPTSMVYQLYEAKTHGYKALWITPGTTHALSYRNYPHEYLEQIRKFVKR